MMNSGSPHQRMILVTGLVGVVILAALWMLVLSPKRSESAQVKESVTAQEARLAEAQTQLASYQSAKKQYPGMLAELKRLDEAVPARGEIQVLLRQIQKRAKARGSDLQVAALKATGGPGASTAGLTPGASQGNGGVATLPFQFTYTGKYFDLVRVLAAARRAVTVKSGDLKIDGRLVTIEGLAFERAEADNPLIKATVSATAYIAAAPPAPAPAAVPAAAATGGS
jgi:Tfp pilus assembly protein PilO